MPAEPVDKYAMAFVDGQNLYQHAKEAFGHYHPNYDLKALHAAVCATNGWKPNLVRFYTGVPSEREDPRWGAYWAKRVLFMKRSGIHITTRPLRYREVKTILSDGTETVERVAQEKGIDIRIALDMVSTARQKQWNVAVIYSQDQDLCEAAEEAKAIAKEQGRWIRICSAFPAGPAATSGRGVDKTDWFKMDQAFYDGCLDHHDYR